MKRSVEIQNAIVEKKNQMAMLKEKGDIEGAYALVAEIKELKHELDVENALAEPALSLETTNKAKEKANAVSAFNKAIKNKPLTEAEAALVEKTDEKGGYLVPEDESTRIEELKRGMGDLKQYCDVIPVTTASGTYTVETENNGELIDFEEDGEIPEGDITFGNIPWAVKARGLIIPVSQMLLDDERANLMEYISRHFAKRATRSDNKKIIEVLKTAETVEGTDYKAINKTLNTGLDTAIAASAVILTNQSGYDYLDSLEDGNGRPLLKDSLADPGTKLFGGKKIVIVNDSEYEAEEGKIEFWVGDMFEFVKFFDRKRYEVKTSEHAGFTKNRILLRCIQRNDVVKNDAAAGKRVVITPVSA